MGLRVLIADRLRDAWAGLWQPWPLRAYLVAFGCALILPGILFGALGIAAFASYDRAAVDRTALDIARGVGHGADRQLAGMITTVRALAASETLEHGDLAGFYIQAKRVLVSGDSNIVVRDLDNRQLLNTRLPWTGEFSTSGDEPPDAKRVERGEPWVSNVYVGAVSKVPLFSVNMPVKLGDGRRLVLTMSAPAASLLPVVQQVPKSWEAGVSDRTHRVVARSRKHDQFVATPISADTQRQTTTREGVWTTTSLVGEHVLRAHVTSDISGWVAAAWVPMSVVQAPYKRSVGLLLLGSAGLLALSVLLASMFGRAMAQPIQDITRTAATLGRGETVPPMARYPLQEANAVSAALREAAQKLKDRRETSERSEKRIREAHERLMLALDITGLGTWDRDLATHKIVWSEGMYRIFGRHHDEFHGAPDEVLSFVHPDDRAEFRRAFEESAYGTTPGFGQEFRIVRPDGEVRWILRRAQIIRSDHGGPLSMLGVALDITERRDREEHIAFLMRELAHRSKNMMAVIQAIAHQTARHSDDIPDFTERFSARLVSLARTQDLLTGKDHKGAFLEELVRTQTEPFIEGETRRLSIEGPPVVLDETATQNVGLALHELATNAAKHGSLSGARGRVAIEWEVVEDPTGPLILRLKWRETDGPTVRPPSRKGFGHIVIERTLADSLQAHVRLDFAPGGLTWEADIPSAHFYILDERILNRRARPPSAPDKTQN